MPITDTRIKTAVIIALMLLITACGPQSAKRAGQGAAVGGLSGAAVGMVSALIWGGSVGEAADLVQQLSFVQFDQERLFRNKSGTVGLLIVFRGMVSLKGLPNTFCG
ncbi:MAG: hypothetical protein KJO28_14040 [Desulfofustis sp.]|nr:hypothetical protein [Desulfofustis sp.]